MISVKGLCPAHLLQALHAQAWPGPDIEFGKLTLPMAVEFILWHHPALRELGEFPEYMHWDYVNNRPLKIIIDRGTLHGEERFDRDAPGGPGTCARVIEELRKVPEAQSTAAAFRAWREWRDAVSKR